MSSTSLKAQRIQCVKQIVERDNNRYGYLSYEPAVTAITSNFQTYPNEFLLDLLQAIKEFGDYHVEVFKDHQIWARTYKNFEDTYSKCASQTYYNMIQQQQQQYYYTQQSGYGQGYQNQNYNYGNQGQQYQQYPNQQYNQYANQGQQPQTTQGQQQFSHQGTRQYHKQNYQQNNQGQTQLPQGQSNYQQNRQYNNQHQGTYVNKNVQGQQNVQRQRNYQNPRFNQQGAQYQGTQNTQYTQGQTHGYQGGTRPYNQRHHYNGYQGQQNYPQQQQAFTEKKVEEKVPEPVVVPEPPKPEPKPMKFSLKEIREFINQFGYDNKQNVNEELIKKVSEVNSWRKGEQSFEEKVDKQPRFDKKPSEAREQRDGRDGRDNRDGNTKFDRGAKYKPSVPTDLVKKDTGLKIQLGANQTLVTKMIKKQIKEKAGQDFATLMQKQNLTLNDIDKAKKEIIYNLNLLAPENIRDIQKDLLQFLFNDEKVCQVLIQQIIEKALSQPKYASTYAKLCSEFSKYDSNQFKFQIKKQGKGKEKKDKQKKENPFKVFLISTVQHSFDKKVQQLPSFENDEEKQTWLKVTKKKILGNVKFIAELIRSKILRKRIMKICISQLLFTFLSKYYYFRKSGKLVDSYYDYYFQALIEFVENVGEYYEKMDQTTKQQQSTSPYEPAEKKIIDLIDMKQIPPEEQIEQITNLKADDYFKLFSIIDNKVLRKNNNRLSALLLNLSERRGNNWQKHHAEAEGPKKLKDIKQDIAREQEEMNKIKSQKKANLEHLNDLVKAMFKDWDTDSKNQKTHIKNILREYSETELFSGFMKQVADEKKDIIRKRIDLFEVLLDSLNIRNFKEAWFNCIKDMAFDSGDYPFVGSAMALILKKVLEKQGNNRLKDYFTTFEDQDQQYFMQEVYGRLYHYTQNQAIKQLTTPSKKYGNMFDN